MVTGKINQENCKNYPIEIEKEILQINLQNILPIKKRIKYLIRRYILLKQAEFEWKASDLYDVNTAIHIELNLRSAHEDLLEAVQCINKGLECSLELGFVEFIIENEERFFEEINKK